MILLAKAVLIVSMMQNAGNATVGSESVSVVSNMDECRGVMIAHMSTKGEVIDVASQTDSLKFTQVSPGWMTNNIKYKLTCKEL